MSDPAEQKSIQPILLIGAVIIIVGAALVFWPEDAPEPVATPEPAPVIEPDPIVKAPEPEPEVFQPAPEAEPEFSEPEPVVIEPEPVDISDAAIESALTTIANNNTVTDLLVNTDLLQRFVVTVTNLANDEMAPNHRLLNRPEQAFRVYQQADREWIDPASYKRYTPYVNAMESMDNERLIVLLDRYEDRIAETFAEIGEPDDSFNETFIQAINNLLDTPEVPVPVEVYTDSVAYKYKDEQLESLSTPQKQLLRTGPDNMRRIKAKLRELKALLERRGS